MGVLSAEWNALFLARYPRAKHTGDRVIIDDILLFAVSIPNLLCYLECVLEVCQKYRLSLKLSKCDFLKDRVEYVGHDLTSDGNCPSKSKFDMITDWPLPATGHALHSLVQLCNFYNKYCPWLEIKLKPLRKLIKQYHRKPIPPAAWTSDLQLLFNEVKVGVTSSPCLARYDRNKPVFLKTDWSADGFGSIIMQPDDSPASLAATKKLRETGHCDFDLTLGGARLRPVKFDSRKCTEQERHFHSFVGEAACGRWAISKNKKFLWGIYFYWLCDCSAIKEILEYTGSIHVVRRWAQELLGYHFAVIHRSAHMMMDVDALSRRYEGLVLKYMHYAAQLAATDRIHRPLAYDTTAFPAHTTKCPAILSPSPLPPRYHRIRRPCTPAPRLQRPLFASSVSPPLPRPSRTASLLSAPPPSFTPPSSASFLFPRHCSLHPALSMSPLDSAPGLFPAFAPPGYPSILGFQPLPACYRPSTPCCASLLLSWFRQRIQFL
jgi:hypothetical protein